MNRSLLTPAILTLAAIFAVFVASSSGPANGAGTPPAIEPGEGIRAPGPDIPPAVDITHDPFRAYDSGTKPPDDPRKPASKFDKSKFIYKGITSGPRGVRAWIGTPGGVKVFKVGDDIGGATVVDIDESRVRLRAEDDEEHELRLTKVPPQEAGGAQPEAAEETQPGDSK